MRKFYTYWKYYIKVYQYGYLLLILADEYTWLLVGIKGAEGS